MHNEIPTQYKIKKGKYRFSVFHSDHCVVLLIWECCFLRPLSSPQKRPTMRSRSRSWWWCVWRSSVSFSPWFTCKRWSNYSLTLQLYLWSRCVSASANKQVVDLSEELARKVEDTVRQQEEISSLLAQLVDLQARCKGVRHKNTNSQSTSVKLFPGSSKAFLFFYFLILVPKSEVN